MQLSSAKVFTAPLLAALLAGLAGCGEAPAPVEQAQPIMPPAAPAQPRPAGLVADDAEWELVSGGYVYTDSPVAGPDGSVYFAAPIQNRLYVASAEGTISVFDENTEMTMGLTLGADNRIYACRNRGAQIVAYTLNGEREVLLSGQMTPLPGKPKAPGEFCNDVAVSRDGKLWFTDRINRKVLLLTPDGSVREVASGFRGNGIALSADEQTLVVTDSEQPRLWAFAVAPDGALAEREGFFGPVHTVSRLGDEAIAEGRPGTNGVTVDAAGRYYVASFYGIQVYGVEGEYIGVIDKPQGFVSNLTFAGTEHNVLYASGTAGLWRLSMQVKGHVR